MRNKFCVKNFVVACGLRKFLMHWQRGDVIWTAQEFDHLWESMYVYDLARRSSEEIVAFKATMYIKRYRRQLLGKSWSVWESCTNFKIDMLWLWKKKQQKNGTLIGYLTTRKVFKSVFALFAMRGHDILYSDWGEKILAWESTSCWAYFCAHVS